MNEGTVRPLWEPDPPDSPDAQAVPHHLRGASDEGTRAEADEESAGATAQGTSLGSTFLSSIITSGGTVLLSLITGILTARLLGDAGRGQVAAVSTWLPTLAWASSLGFSTAMVYHQSKRTAPDGVVISTTLASLPILGGIGVGLAQLLIPVGYAAQTEETQHLARVFLCGVPLLLGVQACWALLSGMHRFTFLNWVRLAQPALYAVALVTLALTHHFTVWAVLAAQVGSFGGTFLIAIVRLLRETPPGRPSMKLARAGINYGIRLQGVSLGQIVATRLDVMMLPAFVSAAALGYYAISVNVASMVMTLFGSLSLVIFPVASRHEGAELRSVVERGLRLAMGGSAVTVGVLAVVSPFLIPFVYGSDFVGAILPLWCLLPGILMWCGNSILSAGLEALDRPGRASLAQLWGLVITVGGLLLTLPRWGIVGAALTSSVAYTSTFLLSFWVLHRAGGISVRTLLAPHAMRQDLSWFYDRITQMFGRKRARSTEGENA